MKTIKSCEFCSKPANNTLLTLCDGHVDEIIQKRVGKQGLIQLETVKQIKESDFETFNACPYCGHPKEEGSECCGEVHDATDYVVYLEGEEIMTEEDFNSKYEIVKTPN